DRVHLPPEGDVVLDDGDALEAVGERRRGDEARSEREDEGARETRHPHGAPPLAGSSGPRIAASVVSVATSSSGVQVSPALASARPMSFCTSQMGDTEPRYPCTRIAKAMVSPAGSST